MGYGRFKLENAPLPSAVACSGSIAFRADHFTDFRAPFSPALRSEHHSKDRPRFAGIRPNQDDRIKFCFAQENVGFFETLRPAAAFARASSADSMPQARRLEASSSSQLCQCARERPSRPLRGASGRGDWSYDFEIIAGLLSDSRGRGGPCRETGPWEPISSSVVSSSVRPRAGL